MTTELAKSENKKMVLDVNDLKVEFDTYGGIVKAVRGVSFSVNEGETLAIVGESGCGKSVSIQSILSLIPTPPGRVTGGSAKICGQELMGLSVSKLNEIRGKDIGVIFQDPMSSLNPTMTIGDQISETLRVHLKMSKSAARTRAIELLKQVQIPEAHLRVDNYPFEFSGGMRQRAMIALAIACEPKLLIADEPTTALDVTIQAQILSLLENLQKKNNMALILITHDLGVVARMADQVAVMYAGQIVERGSAEDLFYRPMHPYTVGLKSALPTRSKDRERLVPIEGAPPDLFSPPIACGYFDRCPQAMNICNRVNPPEFQAKNAVSAKPSGLHFGRCWLRRDNVVAEAL